MQTGINVNIRGGFYPQPSTLKGTGVVRFVFQRWDGARIQSVEETIAYYIPHIRLWHDHGYTVLLVLNQQSSGDGETVFWQPYANTTITEYCERFASMCSKVTRAFIGLNIAYQIFNEGDIKGESSIYLEPHQYAYILKSAVTAIRAVENTAVIISQGHASSATLVLRYWQQVVAAYGSYPNINAVSLHPYGQYPYPTKPQISTGWFGKIQDYLRVVSLINYPIWITEIGVSEEGGFPPEQYPTIAKYMQDMYDVFDKSLTPRVTHFIWFAYSDQMRGAGIVTNNFVVKQPIYDTFMGLSTGVTVPPLPPSTDKRYVTTRNTVNVRAGRSIKEPIVGGVAKGVKLELVDSQCVATAFIGRGDEWLAVRFEGVKGYIRADLVV